MSDIGRSVLRSELTTALNRCSAENGSNTPDFVLAQFLLGCLAAFDAAVNRREVWYGRAPPRLLPFDSSPAPGEAGEGAVDEPCMSCGLPETICACDDAPAAPGGKEETNVPKV